MIRPMTDSATLAVWVHTSSTLGARMPALARFALASEPAPLSRHPAWLNVFRDGLGHDIYALEARLHGHTCGFLPLAFVNSLLFGRFLVSLPYLNSNGVIADAPDVQHALIQRAVELADELNAKHLELRHETPIEHPAFNATLTSKVHMRLDLPDTTEKLWKGFDAKVRNQVRKGEKNLLEVSWGGVDLLEPFYAVLSHNMRDLGTPVYSRELFRSILTTFAEDAEICLVKLGAVPIATALLLHGPGVTEVPTASSLREHNSTCANMLMYRHLLERAVVRKQAIFDFGRSTLDGPTFSFKKQWGAKPYPAAWQYYVRQGAVGEMRPDNPRYQRLIQMWQRLPVRLTQYIGPAIVRGIP
jgi:serine/alanine adding enzyme